MKVEGHIKDELIALGGLQLLNASRQMPFAYPENYFDTLDTSCFKTDNQSIDYVFTKQMPFAAVPENYFDQLSLNILEAVKKSNTILENISKTMPYQIPKAYFEQLPAQVLFKIKTTHSEKRNQGAIFRMVQWAASIAVLLMLSFAIKNAPKKATQDTNFSLEDVSAEEIANYVHNNIDEFDTDILLSSMSNSTIKEIDKANNLSSEEIEAYLNDEGWN